MVGLRGKKQWVLMLALGIFGLLAGVCIVAYSFFVEMTGPFPPAGFLFIGMGLGYMVCSSTVRKLEE